MLILAGCNESSVLSLSEATIYQSMTLKKKNRKSITVPAGSQITGIQFATKESRSGAQSGMMLKTAQGDEIPFDLGSIDLKIEKNDSGRRVPEGLERIKTSAQSTQQGVEVRVALDRREDLSRTDISTASCSIREVVGYHDECSVRSERVCHRDPAGNEHCRELPKEDCRPVEDVVYRPGTKEVTTSRYGDLSQYTIDLVSARVEIIARFGLEVNTARSFSNDGPCKESGL
jgi:hypothetical protein